MIKHYVCYFKKNSKQIELVFNIYQNEMTEVWSHVVESNFRPPQQPQHLNNHIGVLRSDIVQQLIDVTSILGLEFNPDNFNQHDLNELHKKFHFTTESGKDVTNPKKWHELNFIIHKLESVTSQNSYAVWNTQNNSNFVIPIPDELMHHWQFDHNNVVPACTLYLGYYTVGKDLISCYYDNDINLIKENGVRQQEIISSEVIFNMNYRNQPASREMIKDWLRKNRCLNKIDFSLPKFKFQDTRPQLGILDFKNFTEAEIREIWTNWTFEKIDIF